MILILVVALAQRQGADVAAVILILVHMEVGLAAADVTEVIVVGVDTVGELIAAGVAQVVAVLVQTLADFLAAQVALVVAVLIHTDAVGLAADVAGSVLVFIHVIKALQLVAAFIAMPIAIGIRAYVGHPAVTCITIVVAIPVCVIFAKLLHTVSGSVAILTSAVVGPVVAIVA
jgi:hypothetical protein